MAYRRRCIYDKFVDLYPLILTAKHIKRVQNHSEPHFLETMIHEIFNERWKTHQDGKYEYEYHSILFQRMLKPMQLMF